MGYCRTPDRPCGCPASCRLHRGTSPRRHHDNPDETQLSSRCRGAGGGRGVAALGADGHPDPRRQSDRGRRPDRRRRRLLRHPRARTGRQRGGGPRLFPRRARQRERRARRHDRRQHRRRHRQQHGAERRRPRPRGARRPVRAHESGPRLEGARRRHRQDVQREDPGQGRARRGLVVCRQPLPDDPHQVGQGRRAISRT